MNDSVKSDSQMTGAKWVLGFTIAFTYILMVFGNLVTTSGSGLACPDWPLCHGSVNPPKEISIWIEWGHRLLGGTTGLLMIFSAFFMWKEAGSALKLFMKVALGFILVGAVLGGIVVLIEAPLLNSAFRIAVVSIHIIVSTIIFSFLIFGFSSLSPGKGADTKAYTLFLFGLVYFQITLGIIVRYSKSALACPDFPLCHGSLLPPSLAPDVLLHLTHRLTALTIFSLTLWRLVRAFGKDLEKFRPSVTFILVLTQATIGILIVLTKMFFPLLVLHGAVGFALLGWMAYQAGPYIVPAADFNKVKEQEGTVL